MRSVLVALFMVSTILAGCASSDGQKEPLEAIPSQLSKEGIQVPEGAVLNESFDGYVLEFLDAVLPFRQEFSIPEGATMVRFTADPIGAGTVNVAMSHSDTGRRRCNQQSVVDLGAAFVGERSCSSITALDTPGTNWTAVASGPAAADVRIEFLGTPVDGFAGQLNLDQLSKATFDLHETEYLVVPSFDGTELWVEVTLPKGDGPWPTVIASSPYNGEQATANRGVVPAMWTYWTQDWAKRGYAAVNVDVRGYGMSGGCVEVWGINEQLDQKFIVEWVGRQPWSNGKSGFYGQSYVGTTPVAAAVHQAEGLEAIIAVAPVINSYEDWHYGGVPNGESSLSPVAYQVLTATPAPPTDPTQATDMQAFVEHAGDGICDPTLVPRANDPRAVYNEFYAERDFKAKAKDVTAAVLFTEGFEDANVKSAMIPGWFNELESPKLGVFGHWLHQHPARMDQEVLFLGWMDHHVKGKDIGFDDLPQVVVNVDQDWHRQTDTWPTLEADANPAAFGLDFVTGSMARNGGGDGTADLALTPVQGQQDILTEAVVLRAQVDEMLPLINPHVKIAGSAIGENGFIYARLDEHYEGGGQRLLTWGMINLALRDGYDNYQPLVPLQSVTAELPLRPTEHIVKAGIELVLTLRGVAAGETIGTAPPQPGQFTINGAGSSLVIPTLPMDAYEVMPISALP